MKTQLNLAAALVRLSTCIAQLSTASAQITAFTYHGSLMDSGAPANGVDDFQFHLFREPDTNSIPVGGVVTVDLGVSNGLFTALMDFGPELFHFCQKP